MLYLNVHCTYYITLIFDYEQYFQITFEVVGPLIVEAMKMKDHSHVLIRKHFQSQTFYPALNTGETAECARDSETELSVLVISHLFFGDLFIFIEIKMMKTIADSPNYPVPVLDSSSKHGCFFFLQLAPKVS